MLVKLGNYLDIKRGPGLPSENYATEGSLIRLTLGNFNYPNGGFKNNASKQDIYYSGNVKKEYILKKGDLITPLTEQVEGLLGETAWIPEDDKYIQNGDIGLVIPFENVLDKKYCYYLLSSYIIKNQLSAGAQQTKIRHTSPEKIKDCVAPIPSVYYQRKIGNILYEIDRQIERNNLMVKKLQVLTQSIYSYWFNQFEFPNEEGKPYKSSGGEMVWNEELKKLIPKNWTILKLKDILKRVNVNVENDISLPTIDLSVMPAENISLNSLNNSDNFTSNLNRMLEGNILFGSIRPYLKKCGIAPCNGAVAGTVYQFEEIKKKTYNYSVITMSQNSFFEYALKKSKGTRMPVVSADDLLEYSFPYNEKIFNLFNELPLKKIIVKTNKSSKELIQLKEKLLPLLINGQLR